MLNDAKKSPTIDDVADLAGVSYQTVSRVINNHPAVREKTRERVLEAIKALNYEPSGIARSLATKRSNTIGVLTFGTVQYGPNLLSSIEQAARAKGYGISVVSIAAHSQDELLTALSQLRRQQVDGIIVITPLHTLGELSESNTPSKPPMVLVDVVASSSFPFTSIDQHQGGQLGLQHLLELGHRQIVLLGGPLGWNDAESRLKGWRSVLHSQCLEPVALLRGDWSPMSGYLATKAFLEQKKPFTAVLSANDHMALGALKALREARLRVPHDVSVVGFDDTVESPFFEPPLTTVRQDFAELGRKCLEQVVAFIETPDIAPRLQIIQPSLVVRSSTQKVR